jgi:hypothetical protein
MYTPFPYQGANANPSQLATRIPRWLYRELKLYCVENNIPIARFVTETLRFAIYEGKRPPLRAKRYLAPPRP